MRGGEAFVAAEAMDDLLARAESRGVQVLGLEGFLINGEAVFPALSRIADFSWMTPPEAMERARSLLSGPWAPPPRADDQMHREASGRYMIAVVLDE